jgi:hypothetical protein
MLGGNGCEKGRGWGHRKSKIQPLRFKELRTLCVVSKSAATDEDESGYRNNH